MSWLIPWGLCHGPLASGDGSLRKTNKAALARELERNVSPAEVIPEPSATIIDGMSLVQKLKGNDNTFHSFAGTALSHVVHEVLRAGALMLCLTSTRRHPSKMQNEPTEVQAQGSISRTFNLGTTSSSGESYSVVPPTRQVSSQFLVEEWKKPQHREKLEGKELYVTCEQLCFKITKEQWEEAPELKSSQEEADTRLLLHALHAAESGYKSVIITAEDTDVMVLCLGMCHKIPSHLFPEVRDEEPDKIPGYHPH
ncbi:hypothetical protein GWK47_000638 [Chionoecetes opilio]|uniref:Uncharacterized protein n=1 Tax=Chionoecetes opilio TaxID=41210 RepID=A0A8J5CTZ1_CHIOP|nr:hypothetical protein GWK47_000638 [Chionoecetes opilio]